MRNLSLMERELCCAFAEFWPAAQALSRRHRGAFPLAAVRWSDVVAAGDGGLSRLQCFLGVAPFLFRRVSRCENGALWMEVVADEKVEPFGGVAAFNEAVKASVRSKSDLCSVDLPPVGSQLLTDEKSGKFFVQKQANPDPVDPMVEIPATMAMTSIGQMRKRKKNNLNLQKDAKRLKGLKGLPKALIEQVKERQQIELELAPEAIKARQRQQARASLPSFFDLVYLHFRRNRICKCEMGKLVLEIVERRGANSYGPAIRDGSSKRRIVREQLQMLLELLPEWCFISTSEVFPGKKLFNVKSANPAQLGDFRRRTRMKSS